MAVRIYNKSFYVERKLYENFTDVRNRADHTEGLKIIF